MSQATPMPRVEIVCEACGRPTETRLCPACWLELPQDVKNAVWDADDWPDGPCVTAAIERAITVAKGRK